MILESERMCTQFNDILALSKQDVLCEDGSIDIAVADAQYLSSMAKVKAPNNRYQGTRVRSRALGIWALTVKEAQLAFAKLQTHGTFIFRFGWRGMGGANDVHPSGEKV